MQELEAALSKFHIGHKAMQPERWQQIDQLFHLALNKERGERKLFLAEACAGDEVLRGEIEELISSHEQAEEFIESPAADLAAELLAKGQSDLRPGETIGPYQIQSVLGIGGMGEVYLATDTRLGRQVALKLLPPRFTFDPERVRRFEQEARAASALNHPNIVTIYEIGHWNGAQFIVTEFVEGKTLRQLMNEKPLTLNETLNVGIQIAGALTGAHAVGIVHRDIKPENIMLRADGYLKILDFGLAKLTERSTSGEPENPTLMQSNPGLVMGTVQYMSPEQARGIKIDGRTDIWSLGVVLYELLTGAVPFSGETPSHVMVSIMEAEPPPLAERATVPAELDRIVTQSLRKHKKERYQTARELARDLKNLKRELQLGGRLKHSEETDGKLKERATESDRHLAAGGAQASAGTADFGVTHATSSAEYLVREIKRYPLAVGLTAAAVIAATIMIAYLVHRARSADVVSSAGAIDSVAVLPFVNVNNDPNTEYLAEGISDSIINSLTRLPSLKVMSFNSVLRYKGKQTDPQSIGKALNVRAVLMGRMTQQGDSLLISTELVDVRDNRRLWGEQYNRKMSDVIALQTEIAQQISEKLRLRLSSDDKKLLARNYTQDTEAYRLYSLGMYSMRESTKEALEKGIEYFEAAIKADPNYTLAYDGLYRAYYGLGQREYWLPKESRQKMEWAALKAVELDDASIPAHIALGTIRKINWEWAGAEKEYKRALELDPNAFGSNFSPNFSYASFLMDVGRLDEAMVYAKRAEELDQKSGPVVAWVYLYKGDYDKALELYLKSNRASSFQLTQAYLGKGMYAEGIAEMQKSLASNEAPEAWGGYPMLAYAYGKAGRRDEALKILRDQQKLAKQRYISPFNFAIIYTGLDDKDRAFEFLNKACEEHVLNLSHFMYGPMFNTLYSDPRYTELLRRMKLVS